MLLHDYHLVNCLHCPTRALGLHVRRCNQLRRCPCNGHCDVSGVCMFPPYADAACTGSAPTGLPSLPLEVRNATGGRTGYRSIVRPGDTVLYRWGEAATVERVLDRARVQVRSPEAGQFCARGLCEATVTAVAVKAADVTPNGCPWRPPRRASPSGSLPT